MVVGERRDHGNTNAEHGQHHRGHQPVKKPHGNRKLLRVRRHPDAHFCTSAGVIALGSFFSTARLVNDFEKTAYRALSKGSLDGAMPTGNTNGSKLTSRQFPGASDSTSS